MSIEFIILIVLGSLCGGIYLDFKKKKDFQIRLWQLKYKELESKIVEIQEEKDSLEVLLDKKQLLFNDINSIDDASIKKITSLFSDYLLVQYDLSEKYLSFKQRPAYEEAKRIKDLKIETKKYIEQYKMMLYKYEYLLNIFPELVSYVDDFESIKEIDKYTDFNDFSHEFDNVAKYISKDEYKLLSEAERNQLALNNYIKGKKSNWQIGRDFELFCGQQYQNKGWNVQYFGMEKKINDLGRDLIAKKGAETHVVQCKYWSQEKLIHEKHILQLFATTYILQLEKTDGFNQFKPILMTNIELSETALDFAKKLNVKVVKTQMKEFPRIKCNVNGYNKIYHLPFDQKYDQTQIKNKDEFYVTTVDEAISKGFRRAMKYFG